MGVCPVSKGLRCSMLVAILLVKRRKNNTYVFVCFSYCFPRWVGYLDGWLFGVSGGRRSRARGKSPKTKTWLLQKVSFAPKWARDI